MIIGLDILSASSVNVSWERLDGSSITGYIVYYSPTGNGGAEQLFTVPSSQNSVIIRDLMSGVEYQFQVVAVAEVEGDVVMGERLDVSIQQVIPTPATSTPTQSSECEYSEVEEHACDNLAGFGGGGGRIKWETWDCG